tara:strand:- start:3248 stop:3367 length:120 start_codon:yes stop_codon:yes gene_type:complete
MRQLLILGVLMLAFATAPAFAVNCEFEKNTFDLFGTSAP